MDMDVPSKWDPNDLSTNPFALLIATPERKRKFNSEKLIVFPPTSSAFVQNDTEPLMNIGEGSQHPRSYQSVGMPFNSQLNSEESTNPVLQRRSFCEFYTSCSTYLTDSLFFVFVLLPLVGLSCVPCYMGIKYLHQCNFMPELPVVFIYLGGSCIVAAFSRIVYIISKKYSCGPFKDCWNLTTAWIFISGFMFLTETCLFYFTVGFPSTKPGPNYCDPVFYKFVHWNNWTVVIIAIILVIVHGPATCCKTKVAESCNFNQF